MISRSTTQPYGSWDPAVIYSLESARDDIVGSGVELTLSEVVSFGNFCDIVRGYRVNVFVETAYSDIRFGPLPTYLTAR